MFQFWDVTPRRFAPCVSMFGSAQHNPSFKIPLSFHRHNSPYFLDICYSSFGMLSYMKGFNSTVFVAVLSDKVSYFPLLLANNWKYALGWVWQIILECGMKVLGLLSFLLLGERVDMR